MRHSSLPFASPSSECWTQTTGTSASRAFSTSALTFATTVWRPGEPSTTPFCTSTTRSAVLGRFSSVVIRGFSQKSAGRCCGQCLVPLPRGGEHSLRERRHVRADPHEQHLRHGN